MKAIAIYLSQKGLKEITDYLQDSSVAVNIKKNSVATAEVVKAVAKYCEENQYDFLTKRSTEVDLYRYFEKNKIEKKEVTITGISSIIDPENPEKFKDFIGVNDNLFRISDSFLPSKRSYRNWMWKTYNSTLMRLDISRELIENQTVKYDYDTKN
jgi:nucleoid-associated protein YejK